MPPPAAADAWTTALSLRPQVVSAARALRALNRRRCRSCDLDDLIQEGLIAIYRALPRFDPKRGAVGPFASAVAHNRMRDCLGRRRVHRLRMGGDVGTAAARLDRIDEDELLEVLDAIGRLPERQREVIARRYGIGPDEPIRSDAIGRLLGCTRRTARRIQVAALARLRSALG